MYYCPIHKKIFNSLWCPECENCEHDWEYIEDDDFYWKTCKRCNLQLKTQNAPRK